MLNFSQKIFLSQLLFFLLFVAIFYPLVTFVTENIKEKHLRGRLEKVVQTLIREPSQSAMIEKLQELQQHLFFETTLIQAPQEILYSSVKGVKNEEKEHTEAPKSAEVIESQKRKYGFKVRYSAVYEQTMVYIAIPFAFQDTQYVLRGIFPYGQEQELIYRLTLSIVIIGFLAIFLFSLFLGMIIHYLTIPVRKILRSIAPYQMGIEERIPHIDIDKGVLGTDEFFQLANTLNSLSGRIEEHISSSVQEKEEKSLILESLIEGVIAINEEYLIVYMNKTAADFLNVSRDHLIGKSLKGLGLNECLEVVREAKELQRPSTTVLKPSKKRSEYYDLVAVPVKKGKKGVILVLQDKSEMRKVIELGKDFIANASHELKTPITIIRGFAETLHDHPQLSREIHAQITEKIVTNCDRMNTLVKNLLTLAAVDEGLPSSRLGKCDLIDLVGQARQTILTVHREAKISVELIGEEPFITLLDSSLFLQALLNLLENAAKYSKPPAIIEVIIEKREKEFVISVRDQGMGIPKDDLERIFERFYAVDKSHSRNMGGSGLGLSIVQRIVEKHRGRIEVISEVGQGSEFILYIPKDQMTYGEHTKE